MDRVTLAGQTFDVRPLAADDFVALDAWIKTHRTPPLKAFVDQKPLMAGLDPAERKTLLLEAFAEGKDWPPPARTIPGQGLLLATDDGVAELLRLVLTSNGQAITAGDALGIIRQTPMADVLALVASLFGLTVPARNRPVEVA